MSNYIDKTYWIAISHLPRWQTERINRLIIQVVHETKMPLEEFFDLDKGGWKEIFAFTEKELSDLENVKTDLPRLAFIAEQMQNEGIQIITLNSPDYPIVLKENLKVKSSPPIIYIKGRKGLLNEDAIAIVGSRNAGKVSLSFTDHVAKKSALENKVVVSGFAKGVDKQALDSTIEANGKSIIVLPQGILTFQSGFKKYYEPIVNGDVLVLSTFFPTAGWDVGLAMARNIYIYGLAKEIYVAESDSKGGTWEGAMDGLKKERKIFVRYPANKEKNSNLKLIELGAVPVDLDGLPIDLNISPNKIIFGEELGEFKVEEPAAHYNDEIKKIEQEILHLLKKEKYSSKEIILALKLNWDSRKLTNYLKKNSNIKSFGGKPVKYGLNDVINLSLFGDL